MAPPGSMGASGPVADAPPPEATLDSVLIVEDDGELGMLFRDWLQKFYGSGTAVHVTATVADTEAALESLPALDAALIDRKLPDGDGEELVSSVRSRFDAITVMVTGMSPGTELVELPADDYLVKPVDEGTLLKRLSLLEKLDAVGTLKKYSDARKASLLEYHLEDPERNPLFRRFASQWTYDCLEIAHVEGDSIVYELYTGENERESGEVSVSIVGTLGPDLEVLLADGDVAPVGELVPTDDGYAWLDAGGQARIDTGAGSIAIYEFTCDVPERYTSDAGSGDISHSELREILENEFN